MGTIDELKEISETVVKRLRTKKLASGRPFLIWSKKLPQNQSYLEYPDHSIKVVSVAPDLKSFIVVKELTANRLSMFAKN